VYGDALIGLRLAGSLIYRGTFGTGLFQTLYRSGPAHWAMLPSTLEWHLVALLVGLLALAWPIGWWAVALMLGLALLVAGLQGAQARIAPRHGGFRSRCVVAVLCYLQPQVRSWSRHLTRLFSRRAPIRDSLTPVGRAPRMTLSRCCIVDYWSEGWDERTALLDRAITYLDEHRWGKLIDSGWSEWDLEVFCYPWSIIQICTVQEDHGSGRRLIRVGYRLRPNRWIGLAAAVAAAAVILVGVGWSTWLAAAGRVAFLVAALAMWRAATGRAMHLMAIVDGLARQMGLVPCGPSAQAVVSRSRRANGLEPGHGPASERKPPFASITRLGEIPGGLP
jgi:O-antigen biosynthesis protein